MSTVNEGLIMASDGGLLQDDILSPVMNLQVAKKRLAEFQEFVKGYLVQDEDFGIIPGTPKPTLLKPGADKLCELYGLADSYEIIAKVEDYNANPPLFDYTIRCTLVRMRTGVVVATGLGSCTTYESRYRWRKGSRLCPNCHSEAIIKGKEEYGGGWVCYAKKGGCGAKFPDGDASIEKQSVDRVENEDIVDQKNTVLKIGKKRSKIDATLSATRSSGVFTQDIEDMPQFDRSEHESKKQASGQEKKTTPPKKTATQTPPNYRFENGIMDCQILDIRYKAAAESKGKKCNAFVAIKVNAPTNESEMVFVWHVHLHPALATVKNGDRAIFEVKQGGEYLTVEDIKEIAGKKFKDGQLVEPTQEITDHDLPEEMFDEPVKENA